jgi:hypothetical protein
MSPPITAVEPSPAFDVQANPNSRPTVESITIRLADGREMLIDGEKLNDPIGGVLVWNSFGVGVLEAFYRSIGAEHKAEKTRSMWEEDFPGVIWKPQCSPDGWP